MGGRIMRVGAAVVLMGALLATQLEAGVVEATTQADDVAAWNGFSPDFQPDWQGDTATVKMCPDIWDVFGFCGCDVLFPWGDGLPRLSLAQRWTVNRVSSSASVCAAANAKVELLGTQYSASKSDKYSDDSTTNAQFARYAEVVTDTGLLLANGSAIAYQDADIGDRSLSVNGSFSSVAFLDGGVRQGSADALGTSNFTVTYSLEKATPFSLNLDLARLGEANLCFRALDSATGEELFAYETLSGASRHVEFVGILDAGQYTFKLDGSAFSALDSDGLVDLAGLASYNVALDFQAESYSVDLGGSDWLIYCGSECSSGTFEPFQVIDDAGDSSDVPEPATLTLLLLGMLTALGLFHRHFKDA